MKKIAGNPEVDPTLPKVELILNGKKYFLCFTFAAIALAQSELRRAGIECNLLHALDLRDLDASKIIPLLYASMVTYHPDLTVLQVASLVTMKTLAPIFEGIMEAYVASMAEPSEDPKKNPQKPE